jgi:hypothetical protein
MVMYNWATESDKIGSGCTLLELLSGENINGMSFEVRTRICRLSYEDFGKLEEVHCFQGRNVRGRRNQVLLNFLVSWDSL